MAVAENSFGGWIMAARELERAGINPHSDFSELTFGGTHDAVIYAIRDGLVDVGIVRSDSLERMAYKGKINLGDFQVLHEHMQQVAESCADFSFLHSTRFYPEEFADSIAIQPGHHDIQKDQIGGVCSHGVESFNTIQCRRHLKPRLLHSLLEKLKAEVIIIYQKYLHGNKEVPKV